MVRLVYKLVLELVLSSCTFKCYRAVTFEARTNLRDLERSKVETETHATWNYDYWKPRALCSEFDAQLFFPVGVTGDAEAQITRAKSVCSRCPVSMQCLEFALRTNQEYGIWGGRDEEERRVIRRMRRQNRKLVAAS
jgi:WhiB family redox-sensing transcriptional regulator